MANTTTARARTIPRRISQAEARSQTRIKFQARRNIPGTSISYTPRFRKSTTRAAPQTANAMTARARTILRQTGQAEARQNQTRIKRHARGSIPGTKYHKEEVERLCICSKEKAKTATVCARRRSRSRGRRNCQKRDAIVNMKILAKHWSGLAI